MIYCRLLIFFPNPLFRKILSRVPSHCQTVWTGSKLFAKVIGRRHEKLKSFTLMMVRTDTWHSNPTKTNDIRDSGM